MSELQAGRNESVDYQALERDVERQIAAEQKQTTETPQTPSVSDSKFSSPSSSTQSDVGAFAEMGMHALAAAAGPVTLAVTAFASIARDAYNARTPKEQKNNSMFSSASKATHKENHTITPGLQAAGKQNFAGARVKTAGPALRAKQAKGDMTSSIFTTRQSMSSLNDNKVTKGLNTAAAKPATLETASHLSSLKQDLGFIRHEQYHGPKIVADSKILSKDATQALRNGNDQVWDNVDRYASNAKYLSTPTPPNTK